MVEDGSDISSKAVCEQVWETSWNCTIHQGNTSLAQVGILVWRKPGRVRCFLIPDCIPSNLLRLRKSFMRHGKSVDAWVDPDRGRQTSTPCNGKYGYTMSSRLTTDWYTRWWPEVGFSPAVLIWAFAESKSVELGGFAFDRSQKTLSSASACAKRG